MSRLAPGVLLATLCCGCPAQPSKTPSAPAAASPSPVAQQKTQIVLTPGVKATPAPADKIVPPKPAPSDAGAVWREAVGRAKGRAEALTRALKLPKERASLLDPLAQPSLELQQVLLLVRALPVYDRKLGRPVPLARSVRARLAASPFLDAQTLGPEADATWALLVLADPTPLYEERARLSKEGWSSIRSGLEAGSLTKAPWVSTLIEGIQRARDGDWKTGAPKLLAGLKALAASGAGPAKAGAQWKQVEAALASGDLGALREALAGWSAVYTRKDAKGPLLLVRKGG